MAKLVFKKCRLSALLLGAHCSQIDLVLDRGDAENLEAVILDILPLLSADRSLRFLILLKSFVYRYRSRLPLQRQIIVWRGSWVPSLWPFHRVLQLLGVEVLGVSKH